MGTRPRRGFVIIGLLAFAGSALLPSTSSASPRRSVAPLPTSVVPPPAGNGAAFGSAAADAERASGSLDLGAVGYVEDELLVSGQANVYEYDSTGAVEVKSADVPYTTRILVRRPETRRSFSGRVYLETSHPQAAFDFIWSKTADLVFANGDAFVSIATRRGESSAIESMKAFDPVRYGPVDFPEDGLNWDAISQVGRLLKSENPANPLNGYEVEHLYAEGWSGAGALLLFYLSDGFHTRVRMPGGGPIFDAYLVGEPSGYPQINSTQEAIPTSDPRQQVQPVDVPVITLHTRPQEPHRRRPDGDAARDRYRVYEVAGAAHTNIRYPPIYDQSDDFFDIIGQALGCDYDMSRFPMHHLFKSTLVRLDAWAARDIDPPPSRRLALAADSTPKLDEHGNARGGVRSTYTDVPTARYLANASGADPESRCTGLGAQEPLSPEQLGALYENHDEYVDAVARRVQALTRDGWLLPADAREVRSEAAEFRGIEP